jgi:signal transduction histidine kinase
MTTPVSYKGNILVVDDLPHNLELLVAKLGVQGYHVRPASSGRMALLAAQSEPPELVLLDILMPEMDGYDTCRAFKADPTLKDIPIIFLSALDDSLDKIKAFKVGAADYVSKPFHFEEMQLRIETHLMLYRQRHEITQQREFKSRFLAMASHEFRTPLAVIRTSFDLLRLNYERLTPEKRQARFEVINHQITLLNKIVDNLMFFNKLEAGRIEFDPQGVLLSDFCRTLCHQFHELYPQHEFLSPREWPSGHFQLDSELLGHILTNLLNNAFKYSAPGSQVRFYLQEWQDLLVFEIHDQGIGIPQNEQDQLFSPFYRASNAKDLLGTGLGLSIVKQFVELHGGDIEFESQEGQGTFFRVSLPSVRLEEE